MHECSRCNGFVPGPSSSCPNCGAPAPRRASGTIARLAAGAGVVVTLMACYGMAYVPEEEGSPSAGCSDSDGDGHCGNDDCDENDPSINAAAQDPFGDGVDTNCNGEDG